MFAPTWINYYLLPVIKFNGHCLINDNISILRKVIKLYISYIIDTYARDVNTTFTLGYYLFGSVKLTKNTDPDKCKYSSYSIGLDSCSEFPLTESSISKKLT